MHLFLKTQVAMSLILFTLLILIKFLVVFGFFEHSIWVN